VTSLKAKLEVMKRAKEEDAAAHNKELQENKDQAILQALQLEANPQKSPPKKANNRVAYDDDDGDGDVDSTFSQLPGVETHLWECRLHQSNSC
jgi:hypothetical protein